MTAVTFPNGNGYSDDGTTSKDMRNGGHRTNLLPMIGDTITVAAAAVTAAAAAVPAATTATNAATTATAQAAIATAAANTAASLVLVKQPNEIAGIDPVLDFVFSSSLAVPSGVIAGSSGKWVTNQAGVLVNVASGTAPIDYDPITAVVRGLLVEESRTNLLRRSQEFDVSPWTTFGSVTVAANNATAPDGTLTADKLVIASGAGIYQNATVTAGTFTGGIWLRADSAATVTLGSNDGNNAFVSTSCSVTTSWQRFSLTRTTSATTVGLQINGPATVYVWGAQLEAGSFPTSYIPTTSSTVTRAADVNTLLLSNMPGWNASEGTIYVEAAWAGLSGYPGIVSLHDGTYQNSVILFASSNAPNTPRGSVFVAGVAQAAELGQTYTAVSSGQVFKVAFAWKANDFAFSRDGLSAVSDTSGSVPSLTTLQIGGYPAGSTLSGWVRRVTLFPRRLSNSTLQLLTA